MSRWGTKAFIAAVLILFAAAAYAQRELLPASDPIYTFLLRQSMRGNIHGFYWGMIPLSRKEVGAFLDSLEHVSSLSPTDRGLLRDYQTQLSWEHRRNLESSSSFLPDFGFSGIFDDAPQKYLYAHTDSTATVFMDGFASYSYQLGRGDSVGHTYASLGEIGFRVRGTFADRLGYFLQASNGKQFGGSHALALFDPRLRANKKFNSDQESYFDYTNGYLRYDADWLALTIGRDQILWGMGYQDRMVFSDNTVPFDFIKLDLRSGSLRYSFLAGSLITADTTGHTVLSKYIASHRLEFDITSRLRLGLSEAIIYSNQPPLFTLLNPMAFLTSADLSTEIGTKGYADNQHNALIWIDAEYRLLRNVRLNGTWLIDDIDFSKFGKSDLSGNVEKFGWQGGVLWNDALALDNLLLSLEYTRIGPFVETHRTIVNSYTNWGLPLGDHLQPNSDEWGFGADYDITPRLTVHGRLQLQRTGENILDASGYMVYNAGSDLLRGDGDLVHPNIFLEGRRVNRTLGNMQLIWQPIRQYFIELQYFYRSLRYPADALTLHDSVYWTTFRFDY
ncbi:MAG TPA: capsule assembly Wzi family protein [Bacteroidota bacterium]|nr:capsule assembly Wzi family protein [Bacteroidota bacterium]